MWSLSIATVVTLNDTGVDLLTNAGDLERACKCFRKAMQIVRELIHNASNKFVSRSTLVGQVTSLYHHDKICQRISLASAREETIDAKKGTEDVLSSLERQNTRLADMLQLSSHYISTRPVRLSAEPGNELSSVRSGIISASISFNLALTYHLMGFMAAPERATRYWRSARALYAVSNSLRLRSPYKKDFQGELYGLTGLSILNNMGVLLLQLNKDNEATTCFNDLAIEISLLETSKLKGTTGFISNLVLIGPARGTTQAAAA